MPRRPLNPQQETALAELAKADLAYRHVKATAEVEARRIVADRLQEVKSERARRALVVRELGVPKTVAGQQGLHTKDPRALERVIEESLNVGEVIEAAASLASFRWLDRADQTVALNIPGNYTTNPDEGYPDTLVGVVQRSATAPHGWAVVEDPMDEQTEFGALPGFLRWEIETAPRYENDLRERLDAWMGGH